MFYGFCFVRCRLIVPTVALPTTVLPRSGSRIHSKPVNRPARSVAHKGVSQLTPPDYWCVAFPLVYTQIPVAGGRVAWYRPRIASPSV